MAMGSQTCWWRMTRWRVISTSIRAMGHLKDDSYISGFAVNKDGREVASMGLGVGDYDNTGNLSIIDTDFSDDYKSALSQRRWH